MKDLQRRVTNRVQLTTDGHHAYLNAFEHVMVWETYYGKSKPKDHDIHHLNGIKTDNRIENLALLPKAGHTRLEAAEVYKRRIRQLENEVKILKKQGGFL